MWIYYLHNFKGFMPCFFIYNFSSLDPADLGVSWSDTKQGFQFIQSLLLATDNHLNPAIIQVPCMPVQT